MYLEFFKLSRCPFDMVPNPDLFYLTESSRKAYDLIFAAIHRQDPYLLLSGAPGTGKTTLLNYLMGWDDPSVHWIYIHQAQLSDKEFLTCIGQALGLSEEECRSERLTEKLTDAVAAMSIHSLHPVLLIDEADLLGRSTLQSLIAWQAANRTQGAALTIVLAGYKSLLSTLEAMEGGTFTSRSVCHCKLEEFNFQEMASVIDYRLKISDYQGPRLFTQEALKSTFDLSGGNARVVNKICDRCLALCAQDGRATVGEAVVERASEYLLLSREDVEIDPDPPHGSPVVQPEPVKPEKQLSARRLFPRWGWVFAGLLIMLGGGLWYSRLPTPVVPISEHATPPKVEDQSKGVGEDRRLIDSSPDPSLKAGPGKSGPAASMENRAIEPIADLDAAPPAKIEPRPGRIAEARNSPEPPLPPLGDSSVTAGERVSPMGVTDAEVSPTRPTGEWIAQHHEDAVPAPFVPKQQAHIPDPGDSQLDTVISDTVIPSEGFPNPRELESVSPGASTPVDDITYSNGVPGDTPRVLSAPTPADETLEASASLARLSVHSSPSPSKDPALPESRDLTGDSRSPEPVAPPSLDKPISPPAPARESIAVDQASISTSPSIPPPPQKADLPGTPTARAMELINAVEKGDQRKVEQLLRDGVSVDSTNDTGESALMRAAWSGQFHIATLLLNHDARINQQSREGWTALFYGAVMGHKEVVATLLLHQARLDLADRDSRTPLMAAAWNGHAEIAKLFLERGENPNRKNRDGWTSLMFAALNGHIDVARILLFHGADPDLKNNDGDNSAQLAAHQGHKRFLALIHSR